MAALRFAFPKSRAGRISFFYDLGLALLVFLLPLSFALPNILLAPLGILVFFKYDKRKVNYRRISFFLVCIAYLVVLALFKGSFFSEIDFYSRLFMLLLLVVILPQASRFKWIIWAFIGGVFLAILLATYNILAYEDFQLSFESFGNTAAVNALLHIERPYFGFFLALVVYFLLQYKSAFTYILAVLATIFCTLIAARLSLGLIGILWAIKGYQLLGFTKKFRIPILLATGLLAGVILFNNENLRSRFKIGSSLEKTVDRALDYEPRYVIWPCTFEVLETTTDLLVGLQGNEQIEQRLTQCYDRAIIGNPSKKAYYLSEKFNPHSQFLHLLDLAGLGAVLLILLGFGQVFISASIAADKKLLLLLFLLFFMVEAVVFRQLGCYLFGLGLGFLATETRKKD